MGDIVTKLEATGSVRNNRIDLSKTFSVLDVDEFQRFDQEVTNNAAPVNIWTNGSATSASRGSGKTVGAKYIIITNTGKTALEVFEKYDSWLNATGLDDKFLYVSRILPVGGFIVFPTQRGLIFDTEASAGREATVNEGFSVVTKTDGNGYVKTTDYFDHGDTRGVVPGSLNMRFFMPPWVSLGFTATTGALTADTESGLTAGTTYYFKINPDSDGLVSIPFTVDASDTTWGQPVNTDTGILGKITIGLETKYLDGSLNTLPTVSMVDGDIRFTGATAFYNSTLVLDDGASSNLFGNGTVPNNGSGTTFNSTDTFTTYTIDEDDILLDQGDGTGKRINGGSYTVIEPDYVGTGDMYKENGTLVLSDCPPHTSFRISYDYNSPHSGEANAHTDDGNSIVAISARTLSSYANGFIEVLILN